MTASRRALITGSTQGIGFATAVALVHSGVSVMLNGRNESRVQSAARRLRDAVPGADVSAFAADVEDIESCRQLVAAAAADGLDIVIHCAVAAVENIAGRFADTNPHAYPTFVQGALCGLFNVCHAALPHIRPGGAIVALASDAGRIAAPNQSLVGATRAAIMMFVRCLALESAAQGVRVNCVSPTFVEGTPIFDKLLQSSASSRVATARRRAGLGLPNAQEVAALVAYLCGPESARITGQIVSINGGVTT